MLLKKEVLCTCSQKEFISVQQLLTEKKIKFKSKSVSRNFYGLNTRKPVLGTLGENLDLEVQYYIYVAPENGEEAEYLIRELKRSYST